MTDSSARREKKTRPLIPGSVIAILLTAGLLALCAYMRWGRPAGSPQPEKEQTPAESPAALVEEAAELLGERGGTPGTSEQIARLCRRMQGYVDRNRRDILVIGKLAEVYWRTNQLPAAELTVNEAIKRMGSNPPASVLCLKGRLVRMRKGQGSPPLFYFAAALERPAADADVWMEFATEALQNGDEKQKASALPYIDRTLAEGRLTGEQWAEFGTRLAVLKQPKFAAFLERAVAGGLARQNPVVMAKDGLVLLQTGQESWGRQFLSQARAAGSEANRTAVWVPAILNAWAEAEFRINNRDRGRELIAESLGIKPDQRDAYALLARSTAGAEGGEKAEQYLQEGLAKCPSPGDQAFLTLRLGEVREGLKRYRDAAEAYEKAAGLAAIREPSAKGAARCYLRLARYDEADTWITEALRLNPQDPEAVQLKSQLAQARAGGK